MFLQYELPPFLKSVWDRINYRFTTDILIPELKWLCWYVILGQGGGLKPASKLFQWNISTKFQFYLFQTQSTDTPVAACLSAEIRRLGGNDLDIQRIQGQPAFEIDPTETRINDTYNQFREETVKWLIRNREEINPEQSDRILAWCLHKFTEAERQEGHPFSWKGRSVRRIIECADEYFRSNYFQESNHYDSYEVSEWQQDVQVCTWYDREGGLILKRSLSEEGNEQYDQYNAYGEHFSWTGSSSGYNCFFERDSLGNWIEEKVIFVDGLESRYKRSIKYYP